MTSGTGPWRRRRSGSSRNSDLDDGDWLAGYRPSPEDRYDFDRPTTRSSRHDTGDVESELAAQVTAPQTTPGAADSVPRGRSHRVPRTPDDPLARRSDDPLARRSDDRLPGEEPIIRRFEPLPPGVPPPIPTEEPILRFMAPRTRQRAESVVRHDTLDEPAPARAPGRAAHVDPTPPRHRHARDDSDDDHPPRSGRRRRSTADPIIDPIGRPDQVTYRHSAVYDPTTATGYTNAFHAGASAEPRHRPPDRPPTRQVDPLREWESPVRDRQPPTSDREPDRYRLDRPGHAAERPAPGPRRSRSLPDAHPGSAAPPATSPRQRPAPAEPPAPAALRPRRPDDSRSLPRVESTGPTRPADVDPTGSMRATRATTTGGLPRVSATTSGSLPRISATTSGSLRKVTVDPVRPRPKPHSRWMAALGAVGVLALIAVCALGTFFMFKDERNGPADTRKTDASASPAVLKRDISSRVVDPAPLTEAEVFAGSAVPGAANEAPYAVLKTQLSADCAVAATDDLGALMKQLGCSQVVRATLKSPDGMYLITAGIFNLQDESGATRAHENIKPTIDAQKGRFTGLVAGAGTEVIVRAPTILGWQARGHFLAYCVIARADGKVFDPSDPFPAKIQADVLTAHLRDAVIGARAVVQPGSPVQPTASPTR